MADGNDTNLIDDAYTSAKDLITERFSSPFIFSYVISWIVINYKIVVVILSKSTEEFDIYKKLELINSILNSSSFPIPIFDYVIYMHGFVYPLIAALAYTFAYPYADYRITKFTLNRKVKIRNEKVKAEGGMQFSAADVERIEDKYKKSISNLVAQIQRSEYTENQSRTLITDFEMRVKSYEDKELNRTNSEKDLIEARAKLANEQQLHENEKNKLAEEKKQLLNAQNDMASKLNELLKRQTNEVSNDESISKVILVTDGLAKEHLTLVLKIGDYFANLKAKFKSIDDVDLDPVDKIRLDGLVDVGLFNKNTNTKTLNKTYSFTDLGKSVFNYLKTP